MDGFFGFESVNEATNPGWSATYEIGCLDANEASGM